MESGRLTEGVDYWCVIGGGRSIGAHLTQVIHLYIICFSTCAPQWPLPQDPMIRILLSCYWRFTSKGTKVFHSDTVFSMSLPVGLP